MPLMEDFFPLNQPYNQAENVALEVLSTPIILRDLRPKQQVVLDSKIYPIL